MCVCACEHACARVCVCGCVRARVRECVRACVRAGVVCEEYSINFLDYFVGIYVRIQY